MKEPHALLELEHVSSYYRKLNILKEVSLFVGQKEIVTLVGSNGAGKSTLLKTVIGLVTTRSGKILFEGQRIEGLHVGEIIKRGISIAMERRRLFSTLTVLENLEMGGYLRPKNEAFDNDIEFIYGLFPILRERAKQISGTLSGGQQQMLAIGRAIMAKPKLLLLDEPSLGLAPLVTQEIFSVIQELNRQGTTILLVEQNAHIALELAHRAYVIETGTITMEGTGHEVMNDGHVKRAYLGITD